jgi:hypothetical protein
MQNKRGVIWLCTPLTLFTEKGTPPTPYVNLADPWTGPSFKRRKDQHRVPAH